MHIRFRFSPANLVAGAAMLGCIAAQTPMSPIVYTNPVIDRNFPDPSILNDGDFYYAYATNSRRHLPCESSIDLVHWTLLPDAMPVLPDWIKPGRTWAPNVRALVPGKSYINYFCAWDASTNKQAVGAAASTSPSGPFSAPPGTKPLVEQANIGGAIDPSCFIDADGSRYLVWKNDGNSIGVDTWLWVQKLSDDGLRLAGSPTRLIKQDQVWEGSLIEAPTMWKHDGKYYLFYSANGYDSCKYSIGYAVSNSLIGPFVKPRSTPWLSSDANFCGPGGEDIVTDHKGETWMAYHVWANGPNSYRCMYIDHLHWDGDTPVLDGPTQAPTPGPQ